MKKIIGIFLVLSLFLILTPLVSAQYGQYGQPSPSFSIMVNKMVGMVTTTKGGITNVNYFENLSSSDSRFHAGDLIYFQITVQNTSSVSISSMTVQDFVPSYLQPIDFPGSWDSNSRTISWGAGDFGVNEQKVYTLKMQVFSQNDLPADKGLFCEINQTQAFNDVVSDTDNSQFCIEKTVQGAAAVPSAGPEMGVVLFSIETISLGLGLILLKKYKLHLDN